jgi:hypothetical protein
LISDIKVMVFENRVLRRISGSQRDRPVMCVVTKNTVLGYTVCGRETRRFVN